MFRASVAPKLSGASPRSAELTSQGSAVSAHRPLSTNRGIGTGFDFGKIPIHAPDTFATSNSLQAAASLDRRGSPLEPSVRADLDSALGFDFNRVRIHTDEVAWRSAAAIGASAYTTGNHMVFGAGRYAPNSMEGRRLLAHEAFHVAHQQSSAGLRPGIAPPESLSESAADKFASAFVREQGSFKGWETPTSRNAAGPAWEIHRDIIDRTKGTQVHHGDVGAVPVGAPIGGVSVRTGEEIELSSGARLPNMIALEYSGSLSADSRWLQFVWFELVANQPAAQVPVSGNVPTSSGNKPFTTTPASPNWSVDSASTANPFYEAGFTNIRTRSATTMFDRPGGSSVAPLAATVFNSFPGTIFVTFTAHFQTYLIQTGVAAYVVGYSASTTFLPGNAGPTTAGVGYTVSGSGPVTSVPDNLRTILLAGYPSAKVR
jgi:Domain of unknown function (DUF4157)